MSAIKIPAGILAGYCLAWSRSGHPPWLLVSFHDTRAEAEAALTAQLKRETVDHEPRHYRILSDED